MRRPLHRVAAAAVSALLGLFLFVAPAVGGPADDVRVAEELLRYHAQMIHTRQLGANPTIVLQGGHIRPSVSSIGRMSNPISHSRISEIIESIQLVNNTYHDVRIADFFGANSGIGYSTDLIFIWKNKPHNAAIGFIKPEAVCIFGDISNTTKRFSPYIIWTNSPADILNMIIRLYFYIALVHCQFSDTCGNGNPRSIGFDESSLHQFDRLFGVFFRNFICTFRNFDCPPSGLRGITGGFKRKISEHNTYNTSNGTNATRDRLPVTKPCLFFSCYRRPPTHLETFIFTVVGFIFALPGAFGIIWALNNLNWKRILCASGFFFFSWSLTTTYFLFAIGSVPTWLGWLLPILDY
ncbi:hypothetical protein FBZ89_10546 [Nitrospirillum amazonense]|uniref:Uncharacterized protein n=1 Tax=Nitrospirillum amazonense TaxID=28077 RepID=A0A560FHU6_9PROT|nr:hypothetical protein FBZ89_10546 [Nitrospirillum amazonense]